MDGKIEKFLNENRVILQKITDFMLAYNKKVNLTRIVEPSEIIEKHYIDSILPLILTRDVPCGTISSDVALGTSCIDVGSGAGFPGIPMKVYRPDLRITLLESARKRTDYLELLLADIGLSGAGCKVVNGRSEVLSREPLYREKFGLVTARAVANLAALCEYCLPFAEVGGVFLALKGGDCEAEIQSAETAVEVLGGEIENVVKYSLPGGAARNLVVIRKVRQTPSKYPRIGKNITKNPIKNP